MAPNSSGGRRPLGVFRPQIVRLNCNLAVRLGCREPNLERGVLFYPLYILRRDKYLSSRFYVCDSCHSIYNRRSEPIFRKNIVVDSNDRWAPKLKTLGLCCSRTDSPHAKNPPLRPVDISLHCYGATTLPTGDPDNVSTICARPCVLYVRIAPLKYGLGGYVRVVLVTRGGAGDCTLRP